MNIKLGLVVATTGAMMLAGCEHDYSLARMAWVPRAELDMRPLPPTTGGPGLPVGMGPSPTTRLYEEPVGGTYTFTTPKNVTRVKEARGNFTEYRLYAADARDTDHPLVVLTVAPKVESEAAKGGVYKVDKTRTYLLNGLTTVEWTGTTREGFPFCELIVSREGAGDQLHALAVARDEAGRGLALEVLGSIVWTKK